MSLRRSLLGLVLLLLAGVSHAARDGSVHGAVELGAVAWQPATAVAYQHHELLVLLFSDALPQPAHADSGRRFGELDADYHCHSRRCLRVYLLDLGEGSYQVLAAVAQQPEARTALTHADKAEVTLNSAWFWNADTLRGTLSAGFARLSFDAPLLTRRWDSLGESALHYGEAGPGAAALRGWLDDLAEADGEALLAATADPLRSQLQSLSSEVGREHAALIWSTYAEQELRTQLSRCPRVSDLRHCELRLLAGDGSRWRAQVRQLAQGDAWRIAVLERIKLPDLP